MAAHFLLLERLDESSINLIDSPRQLALLLDLSLAQISESPLDGPGATP